MAHGGQPMRDDQRGALVRDPRQRALDRRLGFVVDRRGRLVEHQDRGLAVQRARQRDALALPAGQLRAALADLAVVALRQRRDELVRLGRARRGFHRAPDRARSRRRRCCRRRCRRSGTAPARRSRSRRRSAGRIQRGDVDAVEAGCARASGSMKRSSSLQQRALAAAGAADQRDRLPGRHRQRDRRRPPAGRRRRSRRRSNASRRLRRRPPARRVPRSGSGVSSRSITRSTEAIARWYRSVMSARRVSGHSRRCVRYTSAE